MSTTCSGPLDIAVDMGRGLGLRMTDEGDGRWKLAFDHDAPALAGIEVQAIGRNGQCHPMKMFPGPDAASVFASGPIEKAYRARLVVDHQGQSHMRDIRLPGTADYPVSTGIRGGTLIGMGHNSYIEVLPVGEDRFEISFFEKEIPAKVPPIADVKAEAIGEPTEAEQVRGLVVLPGEDTHSLILQGPIRGAGTLRLAVMMGDHYHTRCVPVTRP